jgi:Tfp pilus assembly protein PilF
MRKLFIAVACLVWGATSLAQEQDVKTLHETARTFQRQGDYANAILVLNRALQQQPNDLELLKDLAFSYYLQRDFIKARDIAKPLPERADADVQSFQILGLVYKAIEERKECEKLYKAGLKKFPNSGMLYNEYGEMLWTKQDYSAIKYWEKGIEVDPNFSGNYYNAARHYYMTYDKVWALIYGEIFLNLESYSKRTAEIKDLMLDGYKKLFAEANLQNKQEIKNPFVNAYLGVMGKNAGQVSQGITPESLTALRTRFVLDWFDKEADKFPFRLFEYQRQLLKEGMFEAYNQWIFGASQNLPAFQNWTTAHAASYNQFTGFQKGRVFKLPSRQYYQTVSAK